MDIDMKKENEEEDQPSKEYLRLLSLWDGQSEYVISGTQMFRVLTPNGKERPLFVPQASEITGYGKTSTGFVQAAEPKRRAVKK